MAGHIAKDVEVEVEAETATAIEGGETVTQVTIRDEPDQDQENIHESDAP